MEQITLYFRQGSSDKVYQAKLEPKENGYVVNYTFGRRGAILSTGTKTPVAVNYGAAKGIYDRLIREKQAKGYTPGEDGTPYQHTDQAQHSTGIHCQLLNPAAEEEVQGLIHDPGFVMQEKYDGRRTLIRKNGKVEGINRKGLIISLPELLVQAAEKIPSNCILDGECVGDWFIAFDALQIDGTGIGSWSYRKRLFAMNQLLIGVGEHIIPIPTAVETSHKADLFQRLKEEGKEGVVFKRLDAPYLPGRPNSGGDQLKYKFVTSGSFIVGQINGKRSVSLLLLDGSQEVPAGNVTIPPNHEVPAVGAIVEVRYLYAFPESGCIYQPVYLGPRDDIEPAECVKDQLKLQVMSQTKLISRKHVKGFALAMATQRTHRFTRVGGEFFIKVEANVKEFIRSYVKSLPSKGKTIT